MSMYFTFIKKELLSNILNLRYSVVFFLFVFLILSSVIIRTQVYKTQYQDYNQNQNKLKEAMSTLTSDWQADALGVTIEKPPNPLSIFAQGLENEMIRSFTLSGWVPPTTGPRKMDTPDFQIFFSLDMVLVINLVCSLLALLLIYDSICGEKENGTLKVLLSGPLPRDVILLSKLAAGWVTLMTPLLISVILSLVYVSVFARISFSTDQYTQLALIFIFSCIYLTFFFALGLAISSFTHKKATALVASLFCWVIISLGIPNLVPMVAKQFSPIPPQSKLIMEKQAIREFVKLNIEPKIREELGGSGEYSNIWTLSRELQKRVDDELVKRERETDRHYNSRIQQQIKLNQTAARLSPSAAYVFACSQIAGTGILDFLNMLKNVETYQKNYLKVKKLKEETTRRRRNRRLPGRSRIDETWKPPQWPEFKTDKPNLNKSLNYITWDLTILFFFSIILFLLAFIGFMRYDPV